jgi:hypothetical protein
MVLMQPGVAAAAASGPAPASTIAVARATLTADVSAGQAGGNGGGISTNTVDLLGLSSLGFSPLPQATPTPGAGAVPGVPSDLPGPLNTADPARNLNAGPENLNPLPMGILPLSSQDLLDIQRAGASAQPGVPAGQSLNIPDTVTSDSALLQLAQNQAQTRIGNEAVTVIDEKGNAKDLPLGTGTGQFNMSNPAVVQPGTVVPVPGDGDQTLKPGDALIMLPNPSTGFPGLKIITPQLVPQAENADPAQPIQVANASGAGDPFAAPASAPQPLPNTSLPLNVLQNPGVPGGFAVTKDGSGQDVLEFVPVDGSAPTVYHPGDAVIQPDGNSVIRLMTDPQGNSVLRTDVLPLPPVHNLLENPAAQNEVPASAQATADASPSGGGATAADGTPVTRSVAADTGTPSTVPANTDTAGGVQTAAASTADQNPTPNVGGQMVAAADPTGSNDTGGNLAG